MIDEGITNGAYAPTTDSALTDLKKFQDFSRSNFKDKFTHYKDMRPVSNQPGRLYATAKTHKFNSPDEITVENLKFPTHNFTSGYIHVQCSKGYSELFETIMPK